MSRTERSVARLVSGLTSAAPGLGSDGDVVADDGEVMTDMLLPAEMGAAEERWPCGWWGWWGGGWGDFAEPMSMCMLRALEGRAREEVMGELRTASRTGSKAGMASLPSLSLRVR